MVELHATRLNDHLSTPHAFWIARLLPHLLAPRPARIILKRAEADMFDYLKQRFEESW